MKTFFAMTTMCFVINLWIKIMDQLEDLSRPFGLVTEDERKLVKFLTNHSHRKWIAPNQLEGTKQIWIILCLFRVHLIDLECTLMGTGPESSRVCFSSPSKTEEMWTCHCPPRPPRRRSCPCPSCCTPLTCSSGSSMECSALVQIVVDIDISINQNMLVHTFTNTNNQH